MSMIEIMKSKLLIRFLFCLCIAYVCLAAVSFAILIPYYFSSMFDYSTYAGLPFFIKIVAELSEHYVSLPLFLAALAFSLPLISLFMLFVAWGSIKISEMTSRLVLISKSLYFISILLVLFSFVPMVWIVREAVVIEGPHIHGWFVESSPIFSSYVAAFMEFTSFMITTLKEWMVRYGAAGLFVAMVVSSIISPIPNEVILAFAGMSMPLVQVMVVGALGSTLGGIFAYYVARLGGRPLAEKFVKKKTLTSMDDWFSMWGSLAILIGRLVPFIPFDVISYFSGITKVRASMFIFLTFLGSLPRCFFYAYVGELIAEYNLPVLTVLAMTVLTAFIVFRLKIKA
jgi:uncharacterized membrane protein YdjX (TVP38/TMEM64 family)